MGDGVVHGIHGWDTNRVGKAVEVVALHEHAPVAHKRDHNRRRRRRLLVSGERRGTERQQRSALVCARRERSVEAMTLRG